MSRRFDHRDEGTFKKDIYFSTKIEAYFFNKWLEKCSNSDTILCVDNPRDNGCGNDGKFIAKGNTAGADYMIDCEVANGDSTLRYTDIPLEVKWVPTAGKFTLKEQDLKAYTEEEASILFIYNSVHCGTNLRKPKNYKLDEYIELLESKSSQFKWGIMWAAEVKEFYGYAKENNLFKNVRYMGNKSSVILKQEDLSKWFIEENWHETIHT